MKISTYDDIVKGKIPLYVSVGDLDSKTKKVVCYDMHIYASIK